MQELCCGDTRLTLIDHCSTAVFTPLQQQGTLTPGQLKSCGSNVLDESSTSEATSDLFLHEGSPQEMRQWEVRQGRHSHHQTCLILGRGAGGGMR